MLFIGAGFEVLFVTKRGPAFRLFSDGMQLRHTTIRMRADTGFTTEHDGIGTFVDGIGDIGNFCPSGNRVGNHAFKEMRGDDAAFAMNRSSVNESPLDTG